MKILAINSSDKQAQISILNDNKKIIHKMDINKSHSEFLLVEIEQLLEKNNLTIQDIDYYSINIGPGSFTGIRIGISFIKAFMLSLNKKTVCVSNFDVMSYKIQSKENCYFILKSNNDEVYYAYYNAGIIEYGYSDIEKLNEKIKSKNALCFALNNEEIKVENLQKITLEEEDFLNVSINKIENEEFSKIEEISPLYIKKSQAEQELQNKILSNLVISTNTDIEKLEELEKKCFEEDFYSKSLLENDLKFDNRIQYFAYFNDELIGYINFEVILDEISLLKICVLEEFRNYKVATKLMEKMIEYKNQNNIQKIFLEVDSENFSAIKLYEKFNFKIDNIRKKYYKNGNDALIMILI